MTTGNSVIVMSAVDAALAQAPGVAADPSPDACIPEVVICRQGFSSSFAVRTLRDLGLDATDIIDGVEGWCAAGLPLHSGPADLRE